jgi:hypothetical protein
MTPEYGRLRFAKPISRQLMEVRVRIHLLLTKHLQT